MECRQIQIITNRLKPTTFLTVWAISLFLMKVIQHFYNLLCRETKVPPRSGTNSSKLDLMAQVVMDNASSLILQMSVRSFPSFIYLDFEIYLFSYYWTHKVICYKYSRVSIHCYDIKKSGQPVSELGSKLAQISERRYCI